MTRRLAGTSVLTVLVVAALVMGTSVAWANSTATYSKHFNTGTWSPMSDDPSGVAYIGNGQYLVVDTNRNVPASNGWIVTSSTGVVQNVATGVNEPTGVDYDPGSNTLFITDDDGEITIVRNYRAGNQTTATVGVDGDDTEDPAYDRNTGVLYYADWLESESSHVVAWIHPGNDGVIGTGDDSEGYAVVTLGGSGDDFEALAWDPFTGNLLLGNRHEDAIYEITINRNDGTMALQGTINTSGVTQLGDIAGLGAAPEEDTLWATSRNSNTVVEFTYNGTSPTTTTSTTTSTTTTAPTTTTTAPTTTTTAPTTTTTTAPTTTTTAPTTTTTAPTTTTTTAPSTTTTTAPSTTTTTAPPTTTTTAPPTTTTAPPDEEPGPNPDQGGFFDTSGHTFESAIGWLAAKGITEGCNPPENDEFCPDDNVTRGQMAAFLVRAFGYKDTGGGGFFSDTVVSVFDTAANRLRVAGITEGCNPPANDRYCPDDFVTRGQMAAFLARAFELTDSGTGGYFDDTDDSVFRVAIDRLRVAGITSGCNPPDNDNYCPDDLVTRGQMAAFLKRGFGE